MCLHSFDDVQDHLDALGLFHMDFGLDRMRNALDALGLFTPPFVTVQIVGTNGKGFTSTFLLCATRTHGLKVGLYTSPHFVTPHECIRINGTVLPADRWPMLTNHVMEAAPNLTYFEFPTALGLLAFAEAGVDLVVTEAGLDGHYDATTTMPVQVACFTPIGMDHEKILGPTLADIASNKSQAMRPGVPAFTAPREAKALDCLLRTAQEKGAELRETASLPLPQSALGLAGPYQRINARLVIAVQDWLVDQHHWPNMLETAAKGLASTHFPGRFQRVSARNGLPPLILDGAHNPHGLCAFETAVRDADIQPVAVTFPRLVDKGISDMLPFIRRIARNAPLFVPTIQDNEWVMNGEELAKLFAEGRGPAIMQPTQRLSLALKETASFVPAGDADRHPVLLCGSSYLLGEFFNLHPQTLEQELV